MPGCILFTTVLVLSVPILLYCCYQDSKSPTFTLSKNEWVCTNEHVYTTMTPVLVGKVMVPMQQVHRDCTQYNKR